MAAEAERRARVAVFGGSFNPPHVAHVLAVVYALSTAPIDEVLVVPVFRHPFAKELASFRRAPGDVRARPGVDPARDGVAGGARARRRGLTLRTVEHLAEAHPDWSLRLLIGADVLGDLPKWHRFDRIAEIAPPLVLGRVGVVPPPPGEGSVPIPTAPLPVLPRVSSTEIRSAIAAGDLDAVRARVPRAVLDFIEQHRLYRGADS